MTPLHHDNHFHENATQAAQIIRTKTGCSSFSSAIILGSGLSSLVDRLQDSTQIPYHQLPGFPQPSVEGHSGAVIAGTMSEKNILMFSGRAHYYEQGDVKAMCTPIACLKELGCSSMAVTNAAGGIAESLAPGDVMLLSDFISSFVGQSPLFGLTGNDRFVDMSEPYDLQMRKSLMQIAAKLGIKLTEGTYVWASGPQFETKAEIRMMKSLGAGAVGMSTVPETILARYYGIRVLGLSNITNMACGLSDEVLSHQHTIEMAEQGAEKIAQLLTALLKQVSD